MYIEKSIIKIIGWFTLFTLVTQANLVTLVTSHTSHPGNPTNTKVILVTKVALVTIVIPVTLATQVILVTKVALVILVTLVTKVTLVILVTLVTLVILVALVTLVILQYCSKVTWHSILDLSFRESSWESRLDSQLLRLYSCKTHQNGTAFVYKRLYRVFVSSNLLSTLDTQLLRESTILVQVLSNLLTSLTSKKVSLLYKITNSTQRLIFTRNSWTMQIVQKQFTFTFACTARVTLCVEILKMLERHFASLK